MRHFLRPIPIDRAQVLRLEALAQRCLDGARFQASDGTWLIAPDGSRERTAMTTRDLCFAVEGAARLIPPEEMAGAINYLLARVREDGLMPERVLADGSASYVVDESVPGLDQPPTDNAAYAVKLVDAYVDATGDWDLFIRHANTLMNAMELVPLSPSGLVWIDPDRAHSSHGLAETVGMTGAIMFPSLLYWEACMVLAKLCQRTQDHEGAHTWFEAAEHTGGNLDDFLERRDGMMRAASMDCRQIDLWGSAYAGVVRAVSKSRTVDIGEWMADRHEKCFLRGCVRHLPAPASWERMLTDDPRGAGQDTGFWPVATGWAAMVLDRYDHGTAVALIGDCIDLLEEKNAPRWITGIEAQGELDLASVANVLAAVRGV